MKRLLFILSLCLTVSTLFANGDAQFKQRVNLALRQTGHHLLLAQEDSTTTIAPIRYESENAYVLQLDCAFDYDILPATLARAFEDYDITNPYHVLIRKCETGVPFLGYNKGALRIGDIPCLGREQEENCANILVQFKEEVVQTETEKTAVPVWAWVLLPVFGTCFLFLFRKKSEETVIEKSDTRLALGQYRFDPKNQMLYYGEESAKLTFRENKLLHFFANKPNEVLSRAEIQAAVWEDEGVIVGRSLDVFISRLRKQLKQDPKVKITNVHGVGYRLELL